MIIIDTNIEWDTTLPFSEQNEECQNKVINITNGTPSNVVYESPSSTLPRALEKDFLYKDVKVIQTFEYVHPYTHRKSGLVKSINYNVKEVSNG